MKRSITFVLIGLLCLILQNALFMNFSIFGIKVDILLIYIVSISMFLDKVELIFVVLPIGILKDAFFPYIFGINTLIYVIVSFVVNLIENKIYKDTIIIPILLTCLSTLIKFILGFIFIYPSGILNYSYEKVFILFIYEIILNAAICPFVYNAVKRINMSEKLKKDWKF
ncbi:MAG: mreD [Caloramator sp.]|uniref:rod shape-determining protein MreD n=1 Tax=Caloramator sp. TaxID=1871330 RepID=UPI001D9CD7BC|nr:rod shape-determining protein MreD [Caloramator sp.]MBZ4662320.1 mreD [Caloramator sp.]